MLSKMEFFVRIETHHKHLRLRALHFATINNFQSSVIATKLFTSEVYWSLGHIFGKKSRDQKSCVKVVSFTGRRQILILMWSYFKRVNYLLFHLKSSKNHKFPDDFKGNRNSWIHLNLLSIRSKIWWRKLLVRRWMTGFSIQIVPFSQIGRIRLKRYNGFWIVISL